MSFILLLLEDPGMLPGGFGWKATWKRVCRRRAVAIHISLGKQKAQRRPGVSKPLEGGDASQKSRQEAAEQEPEFDT
jgi:hypothetical protein